MNWKPDYTVTPQRIVCAANKHPNGTNGAIVIGVRHFDAIMLSTIELRQQVQRHEQWEQVKRDLLISLVTLLIVKLHG